MSTLSEKTAMSKNQQLRALITSPELNFLMESHNALSAKIAEQAGFQGLWASGLTISASLGLADRNEASWTQVIDVVDFITDHVDIPVLLDGDTGFGNYHNVIRLVKKGFVALTGIEKVTHHLCLRDPAR
jgi:phosphoenolpyruvate phosphomutase